MQPHSITIPASIDAAVDELNGIGELITARKWERAAIVAAYVRLPERYSTGLTHGGESPGDFAQRGIVGLATPKSVVKYVHAWLDEHDGKYPKPGSKRRLPNIEFPSMRTGTDGYASPAGAKTTIDRLVDEHGPEAVATAVVERVPVATASKVMETNDARHEVNRIQLQESLLHDHRPVDAGHLDATQNVDYELNQALHGLHSAVVRIEMALRPFSAMRINDEVVDRLRADHDALGMLVSLAGGIPADVSEVL